MSTLLPLGQQEPRPVLVGQTRCFDLAVHAIGPDWIIGGIELLKDLEDE